MIRLAAIVATLGAVWHLAKWTFWEPSLESLFAGAFLAALAKLSYDIAEARHAQ